MSGTKSPLPRGTSGVLGAAPLLYLSGPDGGLVRRRWRVVATSGPDQGQRAELTSWTALIGAAPAAALVLTDDAASRYHAEVDLFAEGLRVRDLESTNGTFTHGDEPVKQAFLRSGEFFRVGESVIRVDAIDEPVPEPPVEDDASDELHGLVGTAPATRRLFARLRRVAQVRSTVLLIGPRGGGRSALARALHEESRRRAGPFVTVDLRAPPDLARAFESARGGTLFLDRVESIPRGRQADLRAALEALPVGGRDLRVVASSTRRLERPLPIDPELAARLSVVVLEVPPLDARPEDIEPIATRFFAEHTDGAVQLGPRCVEALRSYEWPGQVAGLERALARLKNPTAHDDGAWMADLRRLFLGELLAAHRGHVSEASAALGVPTRALFTSLAAHDVDLDEL